MCEHGESGYCVICAALAIAATQQPAPAIAPLPNSDIAAVQQTQPEIDEHALLEQAELAAHAELARLERDELVLDFGAFVKKFFHVMRGRSFSPNMMTERMIAALQAVADGAIQKLLIAVAPGTGKTSLLGLYAAWRLARDPSWRSIHMSHAFDLAATESRRVRRLIEDESFRAYFPDVVLRDDESSVSQWATVHDGRYIAVGTDTNITGKRAHEAVIDDPLNATDRFSNAAREKVWEWFLHSCLTRLDGDNPPVIVVHQRLDKDDLIGRLIAVGGWTLLELPAEFEDGTLLAPEILPREKLEMLKAQSLITYNCQYLQRPSDDANAQIARKWWRFYRKPGSPAGVPRPQGCDTERETVDMPARFDRIVIAVDMTFGGLKKTNDCCDIAAWGAKASDRYLIKRWNKRATQMEQREMIRQFQREFPHAKVLIEKAAGGAGAEELLNADGIPNIVMVSTGGKDKATRLGLVSPTIEGGHAFLPLGDPLTASFVEELAGATSHDDAQDTTSYALADLNAGTDVVQQWEQTTQGMRELAARFGYR